MLQRALASVLVLSLCAVTALAQAPVPAPPRFTDPVDVAAPLSGGRGLLLDLVPIRDGFLALVGESNPIISYRIQRLTAGGLPLPLVTQVPSTTERPRLVATAGRPLLFWTYFSDVSSSAVQFVSAVGEDTRLAEPAGRKVAEGSTFNPVLCGPHVCFAIDHLHDSGAVLDLSGNPQLTGIALPAEVARTRILAADDDGFLLGVDASSARPTSLVHVDSHGRVNWSVPFPSETQRFTADFDGRQFVVVRIDGGRLSAATLSLDGLPGASRPLAAAAITPTSPLSMAWNGAHHLVIVSTLRSDPTGVRQQASSLLAMRIDRDLSPLQSDYAPLDTDPSSAGIPIIAVKESTFLAAWTLRALAAEIVLVAIRSPFTASS